MPRARAGESQGGEALDDIVGVQPGGGGQCVDGDGRRQAAVDLADSGDSFEQALRQRTVTAQLVENGTADARIGEGLEADAAFGLEAIGRLDEAEDAGSLEVFEVHAVRQPRPEPAENVPYQAKVCQDGVVALVVGVRLAVRMRQRLHDSSCERGKKGTAPKASEPRTLSLFPHTSYARSSGLSTAMGCRIRSLGTSWKAMTARSGSERISTCRKGRRRLVSVSRATSLPAKLVRRHSWPRR